VPGGVQLRAVNPCRQISRTSSPFGANSSQPVVLLLEIEISKFLSRQLPARLLEILTLYFGCGTILRYGFGDFHPPG
jgi:hypothetical protein